jgi:AcrR family transcriptional regulator
MDRRTKRTKDSIYNAFTELLLKEKYSKITIQEIIDLADIGRSTFYSHFETKDELLKSMCTDIFDEMHSNYPILLDGNHHSMITDILYHIKENQKIIKGVFLSESSELFMNYFKDYFSNQIEQYVLVSYDERK